MHPCCQRSYSEQKLSIISIVCRICYDNEKEEPLITPCRCKGTVAFVHRSCLETWLAESNTSTCELCHQAFKIERTPKYTSKASVWKWLTMSTHNRAGTGRGVRNDICACSMLTPIAVLITYICLFSSDYYSQKKFVSVPAARWTSLSLLFMVGIMLIGYYLWVYSVIRLHARAWYNWWQRECVVRYVPPSTINIYNDCVDELHTPNNTPASGQRSVMEDDQAEPENIAAESEQSTGKQKRQKSGIFSRFGLRKAECDAQADYFDAEFLQMKCELGELGHDGFPRNTLTLVKDQGVINVIGIRKADLNCSRTASSTTQRSSGASSKSSEASTLLSSLFYSESSDAVDQADPYVPDEIRVITNEIRDTVLSRLSNEQGSNSQEIAHTVLNIPTKASTNSNNQNSRCCMQDSVKESHNIGPKLVASTVVKIFSDGAQCSTFNKTNDSKSHMVAVNIEDGESPMNASDEDETQI